MKRVEKPWGEELWLAHTDRYAGKILKVKKGHRLSLQYHVKKHETLYIDEGVAKFTLEDEKGNLVEMIFNQGELIEIPPGRKHRVEAIEDTKIFEVSTPELDDVVRVTDDYGRSGIK